MDGTAKRQSSASSIVFRESTEPLKLDEFRDQLIRQEETIIFALIERSQFPVNAEVYTAGHREVLGDGSKVDMNISFLDLMLRETEKLHAHVRRYTSPDEAAFFPQDLPAPILPALHYPRVLHPNSININGRVKSLYLESILPKISPPGSINSTYGSTTVADIAVLQALSKRIHFGKFIAEAKFQAEPELYQQLIRANDAEGIMRTLTKPAVEERVLQRVEEKARTFGRDVTDAGPMSEEHCKVPPAVIRELYRDYVIPMTKEVQVMYLLQRIHHNSIAIPGPCDPTSPAYQAALQHFGPEVKDNITSCQGATEVFQAVMANQVCYGVILMEDSAAGALQHASLLSLFCTAKVVISDEVFRTDATTAPTPGLGGAHQPPGNTQRFVIISKVQGVATGNDKTALCFGLSHKPGALRDCLNVFCRYDINVLSVQSLTLGEKPIIFAEVQGHSTEAPIQSAMKDLGGLATFLEFLGSFANQNRQQ